MAETFFDRNKKKSLLALLLLFLRERKAAAGLVFLLVFASGMFLGPFSWVARKWKWPAAAPSYSGLIAAFQAVKAARGLPGTQTLTGRQGPSSTAAADSLRFVKAKRSDLEQASGNPRGLKGFAGRESQAQRKAGAVVLTSADVGGERESALREAIEGGFLKGLLSAAGSGLSPGTAASSAAGAGSSEAAYAGKDFFKGPAKTDASPSNLARSAVAGLPKIPSPTSRAGRAGRMGEKGRLGGKPRAISSSVQQGVAAAGSAGKNQAYTQLAEGGARAELSVKGCQGSNCPAEYVAANAASIYDGNTLSKGFLSGSDPGSNSSGSPSSGVNISGNSSLGGLPSLSIDPNNAVDCVAELSSCQSAKAGPLEKAGEDETQIKTWMGQMPDACGDPCDCTPCHDLKSQIENLCNGDLKTQLSLANQPCQLPVSCSNPDIAVPAASAAGASQNLCQADVGQCGCPNWWCSAGCWVDGVFHDIGKAVGISH